MHTLTTLNGRTLTLDSMHGWEPYTLANGQLAYTKVINGKLEAIPEETFRRAQWAEVDAANVKIETDASKTYIDADQQLGRAKRTAAKIGKPVVTAVQKSQIISDSAKRLSKKK